MSTLADKLDNLARVEDLMVQGYKEARIAEKCIAEGRCTSANAVRMWRIEIQKQWAIEEVEMRPHRKNQLRQRLERRLRLIDSQMRRDGVADTAKIGYHGRWIDVAKLLIALDGLDAPITLKIEGIRDPLQMTPAEREVEIAELEAKRKEWLASRKETEGAGN